MTTQDLHSLAHRWFDEVWNQGSTAALDELIHPGCLAYGFPPDTPPAGPAEFKAAVQQFRHTFSDIRMTVVDVVAEPESPAGPARFAAHWSATMIHTGPGLGFAPTGAPVTLTGISLAHIKDGKIFRAWNAQDLATPIAKLQALATK
jgi:predicted ester cyclase